MSEWKMPTGRRYRPVHQATYALAGPTSDTKFDWKTGMRLHGMNCFSSSFQESPWQQSQAGHFACLFLAPQ